MGDFNYPGINWSMLTSHSTGNDFLELVLDCFLQQLVNGPTRLDNTLDLVLINELQVNDKLRILAPLDNCDHNVLLWEMDRCKKMVNDNNMHLCYNQADYVSMRRYVKDKLSAIDSSAISASTRWESFSSVMKNAINLFVPCKKLIIIERSHCG